MKIGKLAHTRFPVIAPYDGIASFEKNLLKDKFAVIKDKNGAYLGLLTPADILKNPYKLAIDCVTEKPSVDFNAPVESVLELMDIRSFHVLPVFRDNHFYGIITYPQIIRFLERNTREMETQYREIFNSVNDALFVLSSKTGKILDCNHKAESLLGYSKKELQDKILESFSENKSPFLIKSALINREIALAKGELFFEWRMRKRNGEIFWCNKSLKRAAVGEKDRLIVVVRDITEQKNLEKELVCAREKAEKANEVKTTFLANMSHEIRNPLTGILGMTYLLSKSSLPSEQKEQVRALQISAEILSKMLKDMLTVAEIEVGERVSLEETWDLRESLEKLKSHFLILAEEKGLDFNFSIDLENLPKVTGDREAVENILAHLLDNALKFSSEGKIELKTSLTDQDSEKLTLRFEVSDTGPGIPKNFQDEIFGQFIQLDSSTTKKYPGTGLGLYIAKKLAKQMGGSIRLKSSSSRGSVFIADIPLLKSSQ